LRSLIRRDHDGCAAQLERELAELPRATTFPDEVRRAISRVIRAGDPVEIETCARTLAVSSRTLQAQVR
jgi:hypothetical protein